MTKQIIFISHNSSRTGAPIILLNFLRWFKQNTNIPFRIILADTGELEAEFRELAPTFIFNLKPQFGISYRLKRYLRLIKDPTVRLKKWLKNTKISLIYSNTITNSLILESLSFIDAPVISHIHELEYIINWSGIDKFETTKKLTTHFIACANIVKNNLVENHHILPQDITVIHEFIPMVLNQLKSFDEKVLEKELNLPPQAFIVGASATTDWRKGADLFIQLAYIVTQKMKEECIRFVWLGTRGKSIEYIGLQQDVVKAGLTDHIYFIDAKPNPLDYFIRFDIFTLTSREDPYPLVCLENALLRKPIICFDRAGGEPEFVEDDCGFVVPYLDVNAMADRVIELYHSPDLRQKLGENAKKKVMERHNIETTAPKILEVINRFLNQ